MFPPRMAVLVVASSLPLLVGCTPPATQPTALETFTVLDPSEAPLETATLAVESGTTADCLIGQWNADLPDLARQIDFAPTFEDAKTEVTTEGSLVMSFDESGSVAYGGPFTFIVDVNDDIGTAMRVILEHSGQISSRWSISGDQVSLTGTDRSFWTVTPLIFVNGMQLEDPSLFNGIYDASIQDGKMTVSCSGDSLITQPQGSDFITQWERQ